MNSFTREDYRFIQMLLRERAGEISDRINSNEFMSFASKERLRDEIDYCFELLEILEDEEEKTIKKKTVPHDWS